MIRLKDLLNESTSRKYYRAITKNAGDTVLFEPKGYYEAVDDDGKLVINKYDMIMKSNIPELAASKSVGGAILGAWSMLQHYGKTSKAITVHVYRILDVPDKDLSQLRGDDFEWLQEVRYRKPVTGTYVGSFKYDNKFNDEAENFYARLVEPDNPWDEPEVDIDKWEQFERMILTMRESDLR